MKKCCCGFFALLFLFVIFASLGCAGIICKNGKKSVVFSYNPEFQVVDVGPNPTYNKNADWVKKLLVSEEAFLVLTEQKTVKMMEKKNCDKQEQNCLEHSIVSKYDLQTYSKEDGYKYWHGLTEQEQRSLTDINSRLLRKPDFHGPKCSYSPFAGLLSFILIILTV